MDELYKVGERVAQETPGGLDPAALAATLGAGGDIDPALAELLGGGGDIEQYLQSYEQMLQQGVSPGGGPQLNQVDAEGGITVRPEPGFVVKTRDTASGGKVFLNIVHDPNVESPHMKSFAELEGEEGCRVPLSVGTPVEDSDKKGEPCVTYDIVANPDVVAECGRTPNFRETVIQLCISAIAQKYKVELDQRYKLPKMTYKGSTVQLQRIRKKNSSQIQEVPGAANAPMPGQGGGREGAPTPKVGDGGPSQPDFCVFYARQGAPAFDGFAAEWGPPPEEASEAPEYFSGLDLPCYRVNEFQEKIRGTMRNRAQREQAEAETTVEDAAAPGENETREFLAGRTCVVQVKLPELDRHVPSLKQFGVEVSDECLRISFPPLPRSNRAAYAPLTIWWPRLFYSAQATAEWEPKGDALTVTLPTEAPPMESTASFDPNLLDAVF
mmetsp:Transcript_27813/g.58854  ORF Transcript_27813/g.58854 Transcript_27813/m.58854 type:complete len:440 (-) Transcript_27813:66-1385(-)